MKKLAWIAFGVVLALALFVFGYRAYLVSELRKPVLEQLNDPNSAQFRDERAIGNWLLTGTVLCGSVNARNQMGGYTGFSQFEAGIKSATIGRKDDIVPPCDFENDLRSGAPWWWVSW